MGAISFIETMEANSLSITKEEFDMQVLLNSIVFDSHILYRNIERTMTELQQERPSILLDKQQINYENAVHPSRIQSQPLLDPAKAAALLERGSLFAQKTMQRPLSFVGKIFQGLSDTSATSSRAESPVEEQQETPLLPPRPIPDQLIMQRQQFDSNLETLSNMFTNVENNVCQLILHANHGDLAKSVDQ